MRSVLYLGSGELLGRICAIAIIVILGHWYGVVILGVYALATALSQYSQPLIDFGLRHVGARLLAQHPLSGREIVRSVQRRRLLMAGALLPLVLIYTCLAKLPVDMKIFLFAFSAISALYAVSLEWAAWGKNQLQFVGLARAIPPFTILLLLTLRRPVVENVLWWVVAGNAIGYVLQGVMFWAWWQRHQPGETVMRDDLNAIRDSLAWRRTSVMGVAWFGNLAFNSVDMLMLGVMSNPEQVGLYGAAYRVLNQVLVTYYLLTQSLYPRFATLGQQERARMLRLRILLSLFAAGVAVGAMVAALRGPVLTILFGRAFLPASLLLFLLAWAIPLDFLTSYLSNAYFAWGMEKKILLCTTVASGSNVVLNLIWIPAYGARAAAANTLVSYVIFLAGLLLVGRSAKERAGAAQPQPQPIA